jgi:hypothetical protein
MNHKGWRIYLYKPHNWINPFQCTTNSINKLLIHATGLIHFSGTTYSINKLLPGIGFLYLARTNNNCDSLRLKHLIISFNLQFTNQIIECDENYGARRRRVRLIQFYMLSLIACERVYHSSYDHLVIRKIKKLCFRTTTVGQWTTVVIVGRN